ncbi:MAG: preprotein translocase subunit SecE [Candidatus Omnitrophica bacterium CG11_big_fil_rev_8_21_14_0_20_42_13]|uniref:Protein translocase subunit SecE n=1 Tax=Candidatus Ghiorseimicrobium undicola TaxID=1974746 RepID=A0A2H0LVD6_9BACT|nr:MAG: preprotein translocase subunit SecE [Candidatus Omnitrophica bacterium CG11_big_fil_rev_8_21_14_0_20_42_13]
MLVEISRPIVTEKLNTANHKIMVAKIKKFVAEVRTELTKVSWSSRQELLSATFLVITITGLLSVFIGLIDFSFSRILRWLIVMVK